jgi:signal transduction histidine kinase
MTILDSQTTLLLAALLFMVLPFLVWWITIAQRGHDVAWWCAGSLIASLGLLLIAQRPWLPPILTYHAANTLLLASLLLWSQSLRVILGRPWPLSLVLIGVAAAAGYYSLLHAGLDAPARGAAARLALGALSLQTAWLAQKVARASRSHNAAAISVSYLLLGIALGAQALLFFLGGDAASSPFSKTADASLVALATLVTAVIGHFCLAGLVLDRSTHRQVEVQLAQAAAEETVLVDTQLRRLDREDRLVLVAGSLAHELNQPLTAAFTHSQVAERRLRLGKVDHAELDDLLKKVGSCLERASGILERIRRAALARPADTAPFELRATVKATLELFETEWHKRGVSTELTLCGQPVFVRGEEVAISQVLGNLLRNATEALEGKRSQRIEICCETREASARVTIRDHGDGVTEEILARWGEAFVGNRPQGLGLGLAISRAIVAQHQGDLSLVNHPEGGALATLTLPIAVRAAS